MERINDIIVNMDDELFERINNAFYDYMNFFDKEVSRNGYRRMAYKLKKVNLSVDDWLAWCEQ